MSTESGGGKKGDKNCDCVLTVQGMILESVTKINVILKKGQGIIRLNSFLNRTTWIKRRLMTVTSTLNPAPPTPPQKKALPKNKQRSKMPEH